MRLYRCCDAQTGTLVIFRTAEKAFDWIISRCGPWQKYQPWPRNVNHLRIALRESPLSYVEYGVGRIRVWVTTVRDRPPKIKKPAPKKPTPKQEPAAKKPTIIIPWWENIGRKIL